MQRGDSGNGKEKEKEKEKGAPAAPARRLRTWEGFPGMGGRPEKRVRNRVRARRERLPEWEGWPGMGRLARNGRTVPKGEEKGEKGAPAAPGRGEQEKSCRLLV